MVIKSDDMDEFRKIDFEKLSKIKSDLCVSIYIPSHEKGMEVNEGQDKLAFKAELLKIRDRLRTLGRQEKFIEKFLDPAFALIEDTGFWRTMGKGFAFFLHEKDSWNYRLPIQVDTFSALSGSFVLTPLVEMLFTDSFLYYTLALSQKKVRLFKNSRFTSKEIDTKDHIPENAEEVLQYYDFEKQLQGKNMSNQGRGHYQGSGNIMYHGHMESKDESRKYLLEFFRNVNKGVVDLLREKDAPLILVAVDYFHPIYKDANTYKNLRQESVNGNPDLWSEKEIHDKSWEVIQPHFYKPFKNSLAKYSAMAGTGKTSANLEDIIQSADGGRVKSLFLEKDVHIWGNFDPEKKKISVDPEMKISNECLLSLAVEKTIENNGEVFYLDKDKMPEQGAPLVAIYRY